MSLEEAIVLARQGIKMTHNYFTSDEYMTMQGNMIIFEDGAKIFIKEWSEGKDYLKKGWSKFENN